MNVFAPYQKNPRKKEGAPRDDKEAHAGGSKILRGHIAEQREPLQGESGRCRQRQRIALARALYNDPEVLIMDEATSALDKRTEDLVMKAINDLVRRRTIIVIAHRLTTIKDCDNLYFLKDGRIHGHGKFAELQDSVPDFRGMTSTVF